MFSVGRTGPLRRPDDNCSNGAHHDPQGASDQDPEQWPQAGLWVEHERPHETDRDPSPPTFYHEMDDSGLEPQADCGVASNSRTAAKS